MTIAPDNSECVASAEPPARRSGNSGRQGWFVLLLLCWLLLMVWPCLTQESVVVSRADNAVMTLMAAVILAATYIAQRAGDRFHSGLFSSAELLYCGAY